VPGRGHAVEISSPSVLIAGGAQRPRFREQWEQEAIEERTATAIQHKARQGEYTGGWAPYDRRVAPDGARLEPDA
jgi:hypothetical protein